MTPAYQPTPLTGPCHEIRIVDGAKRLLVVFSAVGSREGRFDFWNIGNDSGMHCIWVRNDRPDWYQNGVEDFGSSVEGTAQAIRRWIRALGVEEVLAIGGSQGGYAALLFGSLLNARVLAFGPEVRLGLPYSRSARFMPQDVSVVNADLTSLIARAGIRAHIVAGEQEALDIYNASLAQRDAGAKVATVIDAPHAVPRALMQKRALAGVCKAFFDDEVLPLPDEGAACRIEGFPELAYETFCLNADGAHEAALDAAAKAQALYPTTNITHFYQARSLGALRRYEEALTPATRYAALTPSSPQALFELAKTLRRLGDPLQALVYLRRMLAVDPRDHRAHYLTGLVLKETERLDDAHRHFARAAALKPDIHAYARLAAGTDEDEADSDS